MTLPGVKLSIRTPTSSPRSVGRYDAAYCLVYSATNPTAELTYVRNMEEHLALFGATNSNAAISLYFEQRHGYGLYIVPVRPLPVVTLTVPTITPGSTYTLTIGGQAFSTISITGDTQASILARLATDINSSYGDLAILSGQQLRTSQAVTGTLVTASAPSVAPVYPVVQDVFTALARIPLSAPQGFLCAPEFYSSMDQTNRVLLQSAIDAFCQDSKRRWSAKIDATPAATTGLGFINRARTERLLYNSIQGLASYEFPYLTNAAGVQVPSGLVKVGLILRRWREDGFGQPGSGDSLPVYGVSGTSVPIDDVANEFLNAAGVNVFRTIPTQAGVYSWGSRTVSSDTNWRWETTAVIMNTIAKSLEAVCRGVVFDNRQAFGTLLTRLKASLIATAEEYRQAGLLWGASPEEAYLFVMDETNNTPGEADDGFLDVEAYIKPVPLIEQVRLDVTRVPLASSFSTFLATVQAVEKPTASTQASPTPTGTQGGAK